MKKIFLLGVSALLLLMTSCDQGMYTKGVQGAGMGAAGGAVLGQIIGRNHQATLIGAAVGGLLGYIVGNEMDKKDRMQLNSAYENVPSGQTTSWHNPDTGNSYQVTPQPAYREPGNSQPCRRAEIIATIDGKREKTYTTACRDNNGQWKLQNS